MYVLGIDVGTQGARAIIADLQGCVNAEAARAFPAEALAAPAPGHFEQQPTAWREAVLQAIGEAVAQFTAAGQAAEDIRALAVTSTSGTLCLVDAAGEPLGAAMMYSDARSSGEAAEVQAAGAALGEKLGVRFGASYALCKVRWVQRHEPERLARARWFLSPTDLVNGWLSGTWGVTDWSNALKWGYDVVDLAWPAFIADDLGLPAERFPQVVAPGAIIGRVSAEIARQTGLAGGTLVVSGATDGVASQAASGAVRPGAWNSTLGTTLVLKGVCTALLRDAEGRVYCHRHPEGYWLPGGASNTGADCLAQRFDAARLAALNEAALAVSPTDLVVYPLVRRGERFPFNRPEATGFTLGETNDEATSFVAHLEGLAYVERLAYDVVQALGAEVGDTVHVAGGGTHSAAGLQIRADVLGRRLLVPQTPSGAMGAAILAACGLVGETLTQAAGRMVHYQRVVEPRADYRGRYDALYDRFLGACRERGYVA
ncbi:MAG: FGGY-family carbohydrate kinase [Anaerolineae bacterium]